jgi:putative peptide zinc metalloprotease protein
MTTVLQALPDDSDDFGERGLPRLADGTELAGEFAGFGYREPPLLAYREDGQAVKLPALLYRAVEALDQTVGNLDEREYASADPAGQGRVLAAVARALSERDGREFTAEHVAYLLDEKLAPLGLTTYSDGSVPEVPVAQPFLSLNVRMTVLPPWATWRVAGLFTWLFRAPVLIVAIAAVVLAELWVLGTQHVTLAMEATLHAPAGVLLVVLLAVMSTAFHEVGHSTACRYGGVRPGAMGCGIYVAWPVFYTDITSTYRLGRAGRLRADLAGVYFNGIYIVALAAAYRATGFAPLLLGVLSTNLEIVQQMLPTLRFDGYYVIADFVGIPDLFRYIVPILRRTLLRRPRDERLTALKRWPQVITTIWVLCVVPALVGQLLLLAVNVPALVRSDVTTIRSVALYAAYSSSPVLAVTAATVQILFLLIPLAGVAIIAFQLSRGLSRFGWRRAKAWQAARAGAGTRARASRSRGRHEAHGRRGRRPGCQKTSAVRPRRVP